MTIQVNFDPFNFALLVLTVAIAAIDLLWSRRHRERAQSQGAFAAEAPEEPNTFQGMFGQSDVDVLAKYSQ